MCEYCSLVVFHLMILTSIDDPFFFSLMILDWIIIIAVVKSKLLKIIKNSEITGKLGEK